MSLTNPSTSWAKTHSFCGRFRSESLITNNEFHMNLSLLGSIRKSLFHSCSAILTKEQTGVPQEEESESWKKLGKLDFKAYVLGKTNSVNKALEGAVLLKEQRKIHESTRYSPRRREKNPVDALYRSPH